MAAVMCAPLAVWPGVPRKEADASSYHLRHVVWQTTSACITVDLVSLGVLIMSS